MEDLSFLTIKNKKNFTNWLQIIKPILESKEFQRRKLLFHHENQSLWHHCVKVSFMAYELALKYHADEKTCAIAGLLHDFYEKAWYYTPELEKLPKRFKENFINPKKTKLTQKHAFSHPYEAYKKATQYFPTYMNEKIKDAIEKHMFPLSLLTKEKWPHYKESWIVILADKIDSFTNLPTPKEFLKYLGLSTKNKKKQ